MAVKVVKIDVSSVIGSEGYSIHIEEKVRSNWSNVKTIDRTTGDGSPAIQVEFTDDQRIVIQPRETKRYRYDPKQKTNVRIDDEPKVEEAPKVKEERKPEPNLNRPAPPKPPTPQPQKPTETATQKAYREAQEKVKRDNEEKAQKEKEAAAKASLDEADKKAAEAEEAAKTKLLQNTDAPKQDVTEAKKD